MDFIEVNGTALRYDLSGNGASTLVLIHEMGGTLESWDLVLPMLSARRRVLRYDTRGAGLSQKLRAAPTIDTMVEAGATVLAVEARRTLMLELGELVRRADAARIAVLGRDS